MTDSSIPRTRPRSKLRKLLRNLFRRREVERELDGEIRAYVELLTDEKEAGGLEHAAARRAALMDVGGLEQVKEGVRAVRAGSLAEQFMQDVRFGLRMLWRAPGFSLLAVLCLTLGIGANAAVFSWIEGILLRPFPLVAHQERLMALTGTSHGVAGGPGNSTSVSWPDFVDLRAQCTLFDAFIVDRIMGTTLSVGDRAEVATGSIVSSNYFDALGVRPMMGRGFTPAEDTGRNAHPVTVISYDMWQKRYGSDPAIIGRTQILNGVPHTIVGVTPEGFYGTFVGRAMQFWVPASMQELFDSGQPGYKLEDRGARWIEGYVLLKPGVTEAQAQQEISAAASRLEAAYPETNRGLGIKLFPLWQTPFNGAGALLPTLSIALAVVVFVLLIACANVSNLLLVRAFARRHEMTVRLAVGARRERLLRQLLTEGLVLAVFAGLGGFIVARWCRNSLVLLLPSPGLHVPGEVDGRVLALSSGVCLLATLLFGLVPAMQAGAIDLAAALKAETGGVVGGGRHAVTRSGLVVLQVALSFVLLVGCGLMLKSLRGMHTASPGFSTDKVLVTTIDMAAAGYDAARTRNFEDQLVERLQSIGGIDSAAFARVLPFGYRGYSSAPILVETYQTAHNELPVVSYNEVSPGYLATMGIPLHEGREFKHADDEHAPSVAIVNEAMASQYWPGQNVIGKRFQAKDRWMQIVGVVATVKYRSLLETPQPFFYVPLRQSVPGQTVSIRTSLPAESLARTLAQQIHTMDPNLAVTGVITMREQMNRMTTNQQAAVIMLAVFGTLALVLAAVGLYGVMSYTVSQSERELGLRMALGAAPSSLLRFVLRNGLVLMSAGVAIGLVASFALTRLLGYLLYKTSARDPMACGVALAVMAVTSFAACFVPAQRAAKTDPLRALRGC